MDLILAKYELIIYSNGKIKLTPIKNESYTEALSKCSSRMQQILSAITTMQTLSNNNPDASESEVYTDALKTVAEQFGVNFTTISDKLTRQLNLTAEEARTMIFAYLKNNSSNIKNKLLQNVGKNTIEADTIAINSILL